MGTPFSDPVHDVRRTAPVPPDQEQRLRRDEHGLGRPRRARPWIAVAIAALVVGAFVVIVATGGGEDSPSPGGSVDSPP